MPFHDWTRVYAGLFHDFRQSWSIRIKESLNSGILPDRLAALVEQAGEPKGTDTDSAFYAGKANRIVVKHNLSRTIAVIEIVSPGNKDSKRAFKQFVEKSQAFINAGIHLLVIDLFPPTRRDPHGVHHAIWDDYEDEDVMFEFPEGKNRILASYEAGRDKTAYVEPFAVGDVMPDMPLFLVQGGHVPVPLEATYQTTWSVFPRDMQILVETGKLPDFEDEE